MPKRIQLKRMKGWKMPENTIIVDRRSKYGNPFKIVGDMIYCDASHRRTTFDPWVYFAGPFSSEMVLHSELIEYYKEWLNGSTWNGRVKQREFTIEQLQKELKGKNLACWCKPEAKCHADLLLQIANPKRENV